ncbi:MAG: DoxX family protein [Planctomycetota bacterium]
MGWFLAGAASLLLVATATIKLSGTPAVSEQLSGALGYPERVIPWLAAAQLLGVGLYLYPRTAVLGAVWLTAYLGGATASLVRVGEIFALPVVVGVIVWGALILRDPRLHSVMPWRRRTLS